MPPLHRTVKKCYLHKRKSCSSRTSTSEFVSANLLADPSTASSAVSKSQSESESDVNFVCQLHSNSDTCSNLVIDRDQVDNAIDALECHDHLPNQFEAATFAAELPNKSFPLYRDVLQVVLRYLNINDLLCAMQLSKLWNQAFNTVPCLGLTFNSKVEGIDCLPASCSIARHFTSSTNLQLAMQLPSLTSLTLRNGNMDLPAGVGWLPPQLKELHLTIESPQHCPLLFTVAGRLKQLQDLTLEERHNAFYDLDFSPLLPLAQLQRLTITEFGWQPKEVERLTSLIHFVRETRINCLNLLSRDSRMHQLPFRLLDHQYADPPFPMKHSLTSLDTPCTPSIFQALVKYPSVTQLSTSHVASDMKELKMILGIPQITGLTVSTNVPPTMYRKIEATCDSILDACKLLPRLHSLHVTDVSFNSDQMNTILSHLPYLTDLDLTGASNNSSTFAPLSGYGLQTRLIRLSLKHFYVLATELVAYILPLQELEFLRLEEVCTTVIPERTKERLRNLPNLRECILIHGTPTRDSLRPMLDIDPADQFEADPNQTGTRSRLFEPCIEETTSRNYQTNEYTFATERYHSMSSMQEYRFKSFEELRLEDEAIGLENPPDPRVPPPKARIVLFGPERFGKQPRALPHRR